MVAAENQRIDSMKAVKSEGLPMSETTLEKSDKVVACNGACTSPTASTEPVRWTAKVSIPERAIVVDLYEGAWHIELRPQRHYCLGHRLGRPG